MNEKIEKPTAQIVADVLNALGRVKLTDHAAVIQRMAKRAAVRITWDAKRKVYQ